MDSMRGGLPPVTPEGIEQSRRWSPIIASWTKHDPNRWTAQDVFNLFSTGYTICFLDEQGINPVSFLYADPLGEITAEGAPGYLIRYLRFADNIRGNNMTLHAIAIVASAINQFPHALHVFAPNLPLEYIVASANGFQAPITNALAYRRYLELSDYIPEEWFPEGMITLRYQPK